jgi:type VI secretion system protein ImpH
MGELSREELAERRSRFFRRLAERPFDHDFFQAMRRIESLFPDKPRLGTAPRPKDEPIRLAQEPSMSFAPAAISSLTPGEEGRPPRLEQRFFGLLGPNGALPLHLTDFARERILHGGDRTFARFLDVFHHRFLALFYRAWAQAQPTVSLDRPGDDRFEAYAGSLIGVGTPALAGRDAVGNHAKLYYAGLLARQVRNRDGLQALLAGYFRLPVRVEEFVGHWMRLPREDCTRLGTDVDGARLGIGTVLGAAVWDRQHKFRIEVGSLSLAQYESFLPGGTAIAKLVALVRQYLCFELDWDVRLKLLKREVPKTHLGRYGRLGWTTWAGEYRKVEDAADLTLEAERVLRRYEQAARRRAAAVAGSTVK